MSLFQHNCPTPLSLPATEDQRIWTCPDCGTPWRWDVIEDAGIGWVRGKRPVVEKARARLRVPDYTGPITTGWQYDEDHDPPYLPPWWWPLPARWWRSLTLQWW